MCDARAYLGLGDLGLELLHGREELVDGPRLYRHLLPERGGHLRLLLPTGQRLARQLLVTLSSIKSYGWMDGWTDKGTTRNKNSEWLESS